MDNNTCQICGLKLVSQLALNRHIKSREKIELCDYYHKFYPVYDLYSRELIPFKNIKQYFSTYFINRNNLSKWFLNNKESHQAQDLAYKLITNRINDKKLLFFPSEVELRSSMTPSIVGLENLYHKSYYDIINFPLKKKFDYKNIELKEINKDIEIVVDTREQQPFLLNKFKTNLSKLDVGDYTAAEPFYSDIYIDRKSREDFFGTFGQEKQLERFERELVRANNYGFYLFVVIEKDINDCLNCYLPFSTNNYIVEYAFSNIKKIIQKYDNCQFVFAKNKIGAENLTLKILSNQDNSLKYDWQYLIDKRII